MLGRELLAALLCTAQVLSLPLPNQMGEDDLQVMKCIVEVIANTLAKPKQLPISAECLDTLRGDDRIMSILRHQNLLKELQELAAQGANEREEQKKRNRGFEDELSEVLESQKERDIERDEAEEVPTEEHVFMEAEEKKNNQNSKHEASEERENSLEERESLEHETSLEEENDEKQEGEELEHNDIDEADEMEKRDDGLDNHITDDLDEHVPPRKNGQDNEGQSKDHNANPDLEEEKELVTKKDQEENEREAKMSVKERENERDTFDKENRLETDKSSSQSEKEEEEEEETHQEDKNQDALDLDVDEKNSEDKDNLSEKKGEIYHSKEDETMQRGGNSQQKEVEEESSKEWEDAKRWNKMDELANQLTSRKRTEEEGSQEDPDRSMKIPYKSHKYDLQSQESDVRHSWQHHSKEDSGERGIHISIRPDLEEKKEEEGSANRRTEEQELESLAAIEAELEKVAHKLHELRSG
ncbi:chromogranin-A [Rhinatrema bivittatum]|uniref:chromogranin-A n=1 Tax=Rhinatrema bivittatum TaxID=194408 RepID=UPI00112A7736|nr:chromogranin-A [Rhinatrema bivittatum]